MGVIDRLAVIGLLARVARVARVARGGEEEDGARDGRAEECGFEQNRL